MKNSTPTTTYYYPYFKHEKIGLGGFKKLAHKCVQVQLMGVVSAPMSLQIQVHILTLHSVGTREVLTILVSPLQA